MIFDSWFGLLRVLVVGVSAYAVLVLFLRLSGKRTLAKLNAFDLVVTVALGSTLSSIILGKSVALLEGVLAMALLIVLQLVITWLAVRSRLSWYPTVISSKAPCCNNVLPEMMSWQPSVRRASMMLRGLMPSFSRQMVLSA